MRKLGFIIFSCHLNKPTQINHSYTTSPCHISQACVCPQSPGRVHPSYTCRPPRGKAVQYPTVYRSFFDIPLFPSLWASFLLYLFSFISHVFICLLKAPAAPLLVIMAQLLPPCISFKVYICRRDTTDLALIQEENLKAGVGAEA